MEKDCDPPGGRDDRSMEDAYVRPQCRASSWIPGAEVRRRWHGRRGFGAMGPRRGPAEALAACLV